MLKADIARQITGDAQETQRAKQREDDEKAIKEREKQVQFELSRVDKDWLPAIEDLIKGAAVSGANSVVWHVSYTICNEAREKLRKALQDRGFAVGQIVSKSGSEYEQDYGCWVSWAWTEATISWG